MKKKRKNNLFKFIFLTLLLILLVFFFDNVLQTINGIKVIYYFNKNRLDLVLFYLDKIDDNFFFFINQKNDVYFDKFLIYLLIKDYENSYKLLSKISDNYFQLSKKSKITFLIYKGLYYFSIHKNSEAFNSFKKVLEIQPDNVNAKIYMETLFKIKKSNKNVENKNSSEKKDDKIKNLIIEKIIHENEIKGFKNYKNFINKKNKNEDKYYW